MKKNVVTIDGFQKEEKKRERKERLQRKVRNAGNWLYRNKELVLVLAPAVLGVVTAGTKAASKHASQKKEEELKELYCYDRSLGHYWKLDRELTNSEWVEVDRRKQNGERLGDILDDMSVLK